ncbi:MAG TPA: TraB/GumN family protein [Rhizomicrobium sp.]|nr:TraB/GumN family protein [Rhizomicrobium sp.]
MVAGLLLATQAEADPPPPIDWTNIETVIARPGKPGPLMWRAHKGEAELILIGVVGPVPKDLAWNKDGVTDALTGARLLLTGAKASVGIVEGLWYLAWHSSDVYLPGDMTVDQTLPEALRKRYVAAVAKSGKDPDRYASMRPPLALLRLEGDVIEAEGLSVKEPSDSIERIARHAGVRAKPVADYEAIPMLRQLPAMSQVANLACVKDALDDMDALDAHARAAAEAWANGDLDGMKANYSEQRFQSCLQAVPGAAALFERAVRDSVAAANDALGRKGRTAMVVNVGVLLRKGGILDRLAAEGLEVEGP